MKNFRKLALLQSPSSPGMQGPPAFPSGRNGSTDYHSASTYNRQKTHQRSLSDAPVTKNFSTDNSMMINNKTGHRRVGSFGLPRNCLGDLTSGHGFDNGCMCFEPIFNDLKPIDEDCVCGVSSVSSVQT